MELSVKKPVDTDTKPFEELQDKATEVDKDKVTETSSESSLKPILMVRVENVLHQPYKTTQEIKVLCRLID